MIRFVLLGTGTSTGIPCVGCECDTCISEDIKVTSLSTSLLIQSETTTVIIDTSADFRQQMLRHSVKQIDGIVYTHHHYDHISGFDDVRPFSFFGNHIPANVYIMQETLNNMKQVFSYAFDENAQVGGGLPNAAFTIIDDKPFTIGDIHIQPIPLKHGSLRVNGYRIGNFAYCTDTNHIPEESYVLLKDLDVLILDALRYKEHPTHFTIEQACIEAKKIQAKKTYFTHIAHQIRHKDCNDLLPDYCYLGYDNLEFIID